VSEEGLEFDGRKLALIPENAPQIRAAVQTLRVQLKEARDANQPASPGITQLLIRMDALLEEVSAMSRRLLDAGQRAGLQGWWPTPSTSGRTWLGPSRTGPRKAARNFGRGARTLHSESFRPRQNRTNSSSISREGNSVTWEPWVKRR